MRQGELIRLMNHEIKQIIKVEDMVRFIKLKTKMV